jgi:hypothetical protein
MPAEHASGWSWFEAAPESAGDPSDSELCRACARCLAGSDGQAVIAHLTRSVLDRRLPPSASDAELRHLEGQRYAVAGLLAMVERGRGS